LWQLYIILWKNVYIKRLRRHYITTILEVALVVALLLGIQEYAVTRERMIVRPHTQFPPITPLKYWNSAPNVSAIVKILYHPKAQYLAKLVRESCRALGVSDITAVDSIRSLEDSVNKNRSGVTTTIGVHFMDIDKDSSRVPKSLRFNLIVGHLPVDVHVEFGEHILSRPPGPVKEELFSELTTILPIVGALQQRHLENVARNNSLTKKDVPPVKLQRFPYPSYIQELDVSNYALVLSRFCIGMLVPFAVFSARLTDEKASGMKEMLRIMGMNDWVYWISHYLSSFFMHVIAATLMLLFLCIKHNDKGRSFIQSSDPLLVFCLLMNFCSSCLLHASLLSLFFANPSSAVAGSMMYWTFSCVIPFLTLDNAGGYGYHFIERKNKLWTCIFPGMNLHWGFRVLNRFEKFVDSGANWSNFFDHDVTPDNVTLAEIVMVGLVFDTLIVGLIWYLDNVLPIGPGINKSLGYPFEACYRAPTAAPVKAASKTIQEKLNFEPEPPNQVVAIELAQVNKSYNDVVAVSDCNMRVFESQITVLLGHNGAGKTTILNMITGYIGATSGTVLVRGYDIRNATKDARESVGYCAQHNILFDDLTVEEHLLFFAAVKGAPWDRLPLEVVAVLGEMGLTQVRSMLVDSLSLGYQRRLCMALALIVTPKLVVLDEPTANMDPDARREMWEVLFKLRRQCAILITTQHLDEADVLGDRIAIMANGRVRCMGSPAFLKQRFGTGYHMQVNKAAKCNLPAIEALLRKYAPRVRLQRDSDNEAVFVLGQIMATKHVITMFKDLEQRRRELGIESLGLTVTTLEDVLIRVGEDHHLHRHHMHSEVNDENEMIEARQSVVNAMASNLYSEPGLVDKFRTVIDKRAICTWRQWRMPLFSWLLPPLLLVSLFYLEDVTLRGSGYARGGRGDELHYRFNEVLGSGKGFLQYETQSEFMEKFLGPVLVEQSFMTDVLPADYNIPQYLIDIAQQELRHYVFDIHAGFQMTKKPFLWYNGEDPHAALLALSAFNTARLRNLTQDPKADIAFSVRARASVDASEDEHLEQQNTYRDVLPKVLRSIFFPMVSSLMCSNFVIFPITERMTQVKHLHLMSGISAMLYWFANYFWDFMFYMGTALFVLPPLLTQLNHLTGTDIRAIILLNLLHGFAVLPAIYIMSFFFDNPIQGYSAIAITAFILSFLGCMATVFMEHFAYTVSAPALIVVLEVILQAMRLVPSFSYSRGMTKVLQLSSENKICYTGGTSLERVCHTHAVDFKLSLKMCCELPEGQRHEKAVIQPLSVHRYSAFYEAVTLAVEGVVLFVLLLFIESRWAYRMERVLSAPEERPAPTADGKLTPSATKTALEDTDVVQETALVNTMTSTAARSSDVAPLASAQTVQRPAMIVSRLTKAYGWWEKKVVLRELSFTLRTGECFGLLGVNGAGKTTTFRILTGYFLPAEGDAYLGSFSVVQEPSRVQAHLGYCPQRDGLLDELTGTETLILHSRLKGVTNDVQYIDVLLEIFHLGDIADKLVGTYRQVMPSHFCAGNKRKLSLCLAMIGMPKVLLLDEPYAGIGTTARKRIINYISALQRMAKMSIVLTSHSLTDVEFLANRIAILGSGKLKCLGSLAHLKAKFGKGFTITVKTYPDRKQDFAYHNDVVIAVKTAFRKAELVHSYEGLLEFRMTNVKMPWSEMFGRMGKIKRKFKLQDFFITDTSLEHIYLGFTRREAAESR
ncbi:unnamed protein product, partial [Ixodes hexagonus]